MSNQIINKYNLTSDAMIRQAERINRTTGQNVQGTNNLRQEGMQPSFREILDGRMAQSTVSFSKHASMRTEQRDIKITGSDIEKLQMACEKASQKGIKDALVVMNDSAFILNTPSKVVVTVVDKNEMKENVFTHIDGALFI